MPKPAPGSGDVELVIGGESVILKCTPAAAIALSRRPGAIAGLPGAPGVMSRIQALDIEEMAITIRAGLALTGSALPKLNDWIFEFGLTDMRDELNLYLANLISSGRRAESNQEDGDKGGEGKAPEGEA